MRKFSCLLFLSVSFASCAYAGGWLYDQNHCKVWSNNLTNVTVSWSGACKDGFADGPGKLTWVTNGSSTDTYQGDLKMGYRHGWGIYLFSDGASYEGDWVNSQRNGVARILYGDGSRYEGEVYDGQRMGRGTYFHPDGSGTDGYWDSGRPWISRTFASGGRIFSEFEQANWSGWNVLDTPIPLGTGKCSTTRKIIAEAPGRIAVTLAKPQDCRFNSIKLLIGNEELFLSGTRGFKTSPNGSSHQWNKSSATLLFATQKKYSVDDLHAAALWEDRCSDGDCLSDLPKLKNFDSKRRAFPLSRLIGKGMCSGKVTAIRQIDKGDVLVDVDGVGEKCKATDISLFVGSIMTGGSNVLALVNASGFKAVRNKGGLVKTTYIGTGKPATLRFSAPRQYLDNELTEAAVYDLFCPGADCLIDYEKAGKYTPSVMGIAPRRNTRYTPSLPIEQYREAYAQSKAPGEMLAFIQSFSEDDPESLVPKIIEKLRPALLGDGSWPSLLNAWEYTPDRTVLDALIHGAKTPVQKAELEFALAANLSPSVLFESSPIRFNKGKDRNVSESGKVDIQYLNKTLSGNATIHVSKTSPIKLAHNSFLVKVRYVLDLPIEQFGSGWGTGDNKYTETVSVIKSVLLSPSNQYSNSIDVDFGELMIAYADRGELGGFTRKRLAADPSVSIYIDDFSRVSK